MEIPTKANIKINMAPYFAEHYPDATDCITLDRQIQKLKVDIDKFIKMPVPGNFIEKPKNEAWRRAHLSGLKAMLVKKQNIYALTDCRNKIETVRQEESAQILADGSVAAESRILTDSKTKQYILIGVGAVVVLTVLALVVRKNN